MISVQRGYILLTTLLMIGILTILVLSLMQSVYLDFKMSNQLTMNHQAFYQLESVAKKITNHISEYASQPCVIQEWDPNRVDTVLIRQHGCAISDMQQTELKQTYRYIISDLGVYPCLEIVLDDIRYSSHHWLISIMSERLPTYFLQIRTATIEQLRACELPNVRKISSGVMSWRYTSHR